MLICSINKSKQLEQIKNDIELAKKMADVNSTTELTALSSRMIGYLDLLETSKAKLLYDAQIMEGKIKTLKEFIRVAKMRNQELSINSSLLRQGK